MSPRRDVVTRMKKTVLWKGQWGMSKTGAMAVLLLSSVAVASERTVPTWTRWEQALASSKEYTNPFADVTVSVRYVGPNGASLSTFGFWDGEATFRIRAMFPAPGRWTWRTTCSDPANTGLHGRTGVVQVTAYHGDNPLYRKGYLRVEPGHRYLTYADGTPFLWIGDTAWSAPMNASFEQWQTYVQDRRDKRFTLLQIFCASAWAGTKDVLGNAPFLGAELAQWNPAYWREYEKKVEYANEQGLVVMVVGLMEPVKRYPEVASAQHFARNLAARLQGNFVVFSPSFDSKYMALADSVAAAVRQAAPHHLLTQHSSSSQDAKVYHVQSILDFTGLQSGAGWGSNPLSAATASRTATECTAQLYRLEPAKPIVNLEARYDSAFNQGQLPRLPRSCGYLTILSGAAGYTYGCAGLWNWGQTSVGKDPQASPWSWEEGLHQPSSVEMKHMAEFFGGIEWWRLEPCPGLIRNQPKDWTRRMVMAKTAKGDLAVAYLPDDPSITIDMKAFPSSMQTRWHNPKTGERLDGEMIPNSDESTLSRPAGWEDALLVFFVGRASSHDVSGRAGTGTPDAMNRVWEPRLALR
jgi:hypothetical protein